MKWNESLELLVACERGLRTLVAQAAADGDYAAVQGIANLAKAVATLGEEARVGSASQKTSDLNSVTSQQPKNSDAMPTSTPMNRKHASVAGSYPRFFRRGDELVKVGWSKKDRREYNHRAPRKAVDAVAATLRHVGAKGKMFNGDALLPLKESLNGAALPDYQSYVALAWMKHLGIVEQHGRRSGYTLVSDKQIDSTITAAWPELAEWNG